MKIKRRKVLTKSGVMEAPVSDLERCRIIRHFSSPGAFSMKPSGAVQKWPSKIILAPSIEKGPEMLLAESLDSISRNIVSGKRVADGRFLGMRNWRVGEDYRWVNRRLDDERERERRVQACSRIAVHKAESHAGRIREVAQRKLMEAQPAWARCA